MKKLLVVLLSLGLIVAFSTTASAVDVTFSGQYYLGGMYEDNPMLTPKNEAGYSSFAHAFFYQRVRFQPVFKIAEGLTFTTRFDTLEKQWGNTNMQGGGATDYTNSRRNQPLYNGVGNSQGQKIQESIEFERAYVTFDTAIGQFQVGYQNVDAWGTDWGDYNNSAPSIKYATKLGSLTLALIYEKFYENDTAGTPAAAAITAAGHPAVPGGAVATTYNNNIDADNDTYALAAIYNAKGLEAGLLYKYYVYNKARSVSGYKTERNLISPYLKATFGPVYIEGEAQYWFGKDKAYETVMATPDVDLQAYGAYLKAKVTVGPAYFGALLAYQSGNDFSDAKKTTLNPGGHGSSFVHSLILLYEPTSTWSNSGSTAANLYGSSNYILYNAFVGFNPTPKLNVEVKLNSATVDKKALTATTEAISANLGMEFDLTATYKIYDNLSYMVGAGYLQTGDYFKGTNANNKIADNYILLNQLTLNF